MPRDLFYTLSSANYSAVTLSPYDPLSNATSSSPPASVIASLQSFDVYAQLEFSPRTDTINGTAPLGSVWHTGDNSLAENATTPYFVAKDYGPKYLNSAAGSYQVVQPLVTSVQSDGNFTMSTITMSKQLNGTAPKLTAPGHAAFEVLEGQLIFNMEGETISLLDGDVVFIPGNTAFSYWSEIAYTKVLYIGAGSEGVAASLIAGGKDWESPVWPTA